MENDYSPADDGDDDYKKNLQRIRSGLQIAAPDAAGSIASYAMDLRPEIRAARGRGLTYREIAEIFKASGVPAEPDAIRVALGRNVVTKVARGRRVAAAKPAAPLNETGATRTDGAAISLRLK